MKAIEASMTNRKAQRKSRRGTPFLAKEVLTDKINSALLVDRLRGIEVNAVRIAAHARRILSEHYSLPLACIDVEVDAESGAVNICATPEEGESIVLCLQ